jgi:YggT family protein
VILSWVLSPFHPIRQTLTRIIDPLLNPIRRWMPQTGPFDFSVLVLFIILQIFESMLRRTLVTLQ